MSGKAGPENISGVHGPAVVEGLGTAFAWLTVFPARGAQVFDTITGRRAMLSMPVVGAVIGVIFAVLSSAAVRLNLPAFFTAAVLVIVGELLTRMMHLDGLADVGDALGSYAEPVKAREILADKYTGALGFGAVLLTLGGLWAGLSALSAVGPLAGLLVGCVPFVARLAALAGCTVAYAPLSATGFGALVIGTVPSLWHRVWVVVGVLVCGGVSAAALAPVLPLSSWVVAMVVVVVVLVVLALVNGLLMHMRRRFGGLNGDCLGAAIEIGGAVCAVLLTVAVYGVAAVATV
ncbi:adenosylcobinamide-GDP ribazoletransferase [Corynebacterium aquilae]|uniref:Adenosylcobinamide-GDP ribazoletransferase n=1 Tax=Corynebacterium aquilae DSM 44791 TaxID=1431546 RepID=A0A1L7CGZ3_9CORY|nr:adenosylcobinamide-GDP ribazoletransferase [Corynebacterium aquilae]APT85131.1 hypothetical protein CAQU_08665 [Corynebacterium aquilae DSM 44791]